jgi:hypothetical protein
MVRGLAAFGVRRRPTLVAVSDPKRGFDLAFAAACEAGDLETAEIHLGHAMDELYRLYELAKRSSSGADRRARDEALASIDKGQVAGAVVWARKYRIHDSMEVSRAAGLYSDYYTNLYGVLAWLPRSDFTEQDDDGRGWHLSYDAYLEGRPVLDTLRHAAKALVALVTLTNPLSVSAGVVVRGSPLRWFCAAGLRGTARDHAGRGSPTCWGECAERASAYGVDFGRERSDPGSEATGKGGPGGTGCGGSPGQAVSAQRRPPCR